MPHRCPFCVLAPSGPACCSHADQQGRVAPPDFAIAEDPSEASAGLQAESMQAGLLGNVDAPNFTVERIPELIALKADAVFAAFNPFFNLFVFFKASLRVDMYHCMGQF